MKKKTNNLFPRTRDRKTKQEKQEHMHKISIPSPGEETQENIYAPYKNRDQFCMLTHSDHQPLPMTHSPKQNHQNTARHCEA